MLLELERAITGGPGGAPTHAQRNVRLFSYFTIQPNILVQVTSWLLAWKPDLGGCLFRVARLDTLLCIAVTDLVFPTVLAEDGAQLTPSGNLAGFLARTPVSWPSSSSHSPGCSGASTGVYRRHRGRTRRERANGDC